MKGVVNVLLASFMALATLGIRAPRNEQSEASAHPAEPVHAILDAFKSHSIVALAEGDHGNQPAHDFRMTLLRDPAFPSVVNDIVVEAGNARYQPVMDRFLLCDRVADVELREAWQNTTVAEPLWDLPIYAELFRSVRALNLASPQGPHVRLLLGDPPIDWNDVRSAADLGKWLAERDSYPASVILREVLEKHRRALIIYGDGHLWRHIPRPTIVSLLEAAGASVFAVSTPTTADWVRLQPEIASWRAPALALVFGNRLGGYGFADYYVRQGPGNPWRNFRMQDQSDAVQRWAEDRDHESHPVPTLCAGWLISRDATTPDGPQWIDGAGHRRPSQACMGSTP